MRAGRKLARWIGSRPTSKPLARSHNLPFKSAQLISLSRQMPTKASEILGAMRSKGLFPFRFDNTSTSRAEGLSLNSMEKRVRRPSRTISPIASIPQSSRGSSSFQCHSRAESCVHSARVASRNCCSVEIVLCLLNLPCLVHSKLTDFSKLKPYLLTKLRFY